MCSQGNDSVNICDIIRRWKYNSFNMLGHSHFVPISLYHYASCRWPFQVCGHQQWPCWLKFDNMIQQVWRLTAIGFIVIVGLFSQCQCIVNSLSPERCGSNKGWCATARVMIWKSLRSRQNGRHLPDDIFKCISFNENVWISIEISLKFVRKGSINNIPALVLIMAWRRPGDKPLSGLMMVRLLRHICITQPQWVNCTCHKWSVRCASFCCLIQGKPIRFSLYPRKVFAVDLCSFNDFLASLEK